MVRLPDVAMMRERQFPSLGPKGFHRVAYTEWGSGDARATVICAHGLTRQGRDFDVLAGALADRFRVACPDVVGRGMSDWLSEAHDYGYPVYMADMAALIARLDASEVAWVGTSMGGLIGIMLAARPNSPIGRLVVNDIGPFIPKQALTRIAGYVDGAGPFASLEAVEAYLRRVHAPFGPLADAEWRHLARHGARPDGAGGFRLHYDPKIATPFREAATTDVDLWSVWDLVRCPTLVLRGAESDLLARETAAEMERRGPRAKVVEFAGVGHAPALMAGEQIEVVRRWLLEGAP